VALIRFFDLGFQRGPPHGQLKIGGALVYL
jgi:hypothetical protein